jgi:hypothetical protein
MTEIYGEEERWSRVSRKRRVSMSGIARSRFKLCLDPPGDIGPLLFLIPK